MNDKNLFSIGEVVKAVGITRKIILNKNIFQRYNGFTADDKQA